MKSLVKFGLLGLCALAAAPTRAADQWIKLSECSLSAADLHEVAIYALTKKRYNIEEDTPARVVGEQRGKKVEIVIEPNSMVIRWVEGFADPKDQWLRNLKTDLLWRLAE